MRRTLLLSASPTRAAGAEFTRGCVAVLPMLIGIIPFALLLGAQAAAKGMSAVELPLLTGLNFAGGSEFAAIALWTSPPHIFAIMMVTLLVNSRHLLMGAAMAPALSHLPLRKAIPALLVMCDESWALGMADAARRRQAGLSPGFSMAYYAGVAGSLWVMWVVFTGLGVLTGPVLGDITRWGFDMAFPAVFLVLLRGMWKGARTAFAWLVSLIAAATTWHYFPGSAYYVPVGAGAGILTILIMSARSPS
ncbi:MULTISPECIES: AzlC family ABC transporter permease [Tenebrionibacter/Tenebrionicola group]|jgi:4-azaleucine resistance transporter AzlC|uniref:AzlC family ABC transporter permease n=2 Tax=Tenebrionibacter/Tenebrionicola group TaxID=2969848 RepID=A0A8K0XYB6_9ENTR|nr:MULTISPECIES: AzlC family ABC transporter permease [Tenebrionibacter/Tenebrionicola group]MBK4716237.1 AzlC family ABC transporter permease [Tenebrionibacter intestinalis]MBV5096892.1 AzlC family ABC transporter permease [Tenebrionicola larvae]